MRASLTSTWKDCFGSNRALAIGSSARIRDRNPPQPSEPAAGRLVLCRANAEQLDHRSRSWTRTSDVTWTAPGSDDDRRSGVTPAFSSSVSQRRGERRSGAGDPRLLPRQCEQQSAGRLPAATDHPTRSSHSSTGSDYVLQPSPKIALSRGKTSPKAPAARNRTQHMGARVSGVPIGRLRAVASRWASELRLFGMLGQRRNLAPARRNERHAGRSHPPHKHRPTEVDGDGRRSERIRVSLRSR